MRLKYYFSKEVCWVRWRGWLLHWKQTPPLFSERYGYRRYWSIPFTDWRIRLEHQSKGGV